MNQDLIRNVMFDLGVVLVHLEYESARERCLAYCDPRRIGKAADFLRLLGRSPVVDAYERGELTAREFYRYFVEHTGFSGGFETFVEIWRSIFRENEPMIEFGRELSARYPIYFMTNASDLHVPWIFSRFPRLAFFRDVACSCYLRAAKPDPEYYRRALAQFGVGAGESLFIDDRPENIEGARALGFRCVLYQSPEQTIADVRAMLIGA